METVLLILALIGGIVVAAAAIYGLMWVLSERGITIAEALIAAVVITVLVVLLAGCGEQKKAPETTNFKRGRKIELFLVEGREKARAMAVLDSLGLPLAERIEGVDREIVSEGILAAVRTVARKKSLTIDKMVEVATPLVVYLEEVARDGNSYAVSISTIEDIINVLEIKEGKTETRIAFGKALLKFMK